MEPKEFYKKLHSLNWDNGAGEALEFVRKHRENLSAKSADGWTLIQTLMIFSEDEDAIETVIKEVIDLIDDTSLNEVGELGQTSLFTAVVRERRNIVEKLLSRNADVSIRDRKKQRVPLHAACFNGDVETVKILLNHNEKLARCRDNEGLTPLDVSCWKGHHGVVKVLLARDPEPLYMTDNNGMSPLHTATEYGHKDIIETILMKADIVEKAKNNGATPLDCACESGFKEIAVLLIDNGAQIECRDESGFTPLLTACSSGYLDIVNLLLERGAKISAVTYENQSCLMRASRNGHPTIVRRLLELDAICGLIDEPGKDGATPLVMACEFGHTEIVSLLLGAGADRMKAGSNGYSPLMDACKWRYSAIVKLLLEHRDTDDNKNNVKVLSQRNNEDDGFTPLQYACYYGHLKIVKILLQHDTDVNEVDADGRTALHNATRQGYKEIVEILSTKVQDINAVDNLGWTALHYASWCRVEEGDVQAEEQLGDNSFPETDESISVSGKYAEILQHLLKTGAHMTLTTETKLTPVHLASEQGHHSRVAVLLGNLRKVEEILRLKDSNNKTALCLAMEQKNGYVVRQLLDKMSIADFGDATNKDNLILWLAKRPETHELARLLLSKDNSEMDNHPATSVRTWGALEWAAYRGYPGLVWWLLFTSEPGPERDRKIKTAEGIAGRFAIRRRDKGHVVGTKRVELDSKDNRQDWVEDADGKPDSSREADLEEKHVQVLMILRNPPMTQTAGQRQLLTQSSDKPLYLPHSLELINYYMANVIDCYSFKDRSGFLRRFATVKDVIYTRGPVQIMNEAREKTHKLDSRYGPRDGTAGYAWNEDDVNVRWIHLPANNMKWMSDIAMTVSVDSNIDGNGLAWLDRSWDQVAGKSLSSRFMKPKCVYRTQINCSDETTDEDEEPDEVDEIDESDDEDSIDTSGNNAREGEDEEDSDGPTQAAIYMPYLTIAKHQRDLDDFLPQYKCLLEDYNNGVIQGSRTLDEFFYHSCEDENLRHDILRRNSDQVLSKNIHGIVSELDSWALLNVDQVWIWVIDNKTIVTSSTHRRDDSEDPLLTAVLEKLSRANEASSENRGPANTFEMSRIIIDTCVGFFDREVQMNIETKRKCPATTWRGSVQDVFTSALAQAAMREAALYDQFATVEASVPPEKIQTLGSNQKRREVLEAANLFREIKDIRDELKMLRTIAEYQMVVQKDAPDLSSSSSNLLSSESIVNDLREMDNSASRIENAVNTTLSLEQNEISIAQAQEAANQGRTLMLFTVVTILFLPMSFFTSLFALDVASFQQTPTWAFLVLFSVSLAIFIPLAMYAIFSDSVTAFYYFLLEYFGTVKDVNPTRPNKPIWKPVPSGRTFDSNEGTILGASKTSLGVVDENVRDKLARRRRVRTEYDEEALYKKTWH